MDISKALGKGKEYEILGEKVMLSPLKVKNMDLIFDLQKEDKKSKAIQKLIMIYGKQVFPEASDAQLEELDFDIVQKIVDCIADVNGMNKED